MSKPDLLALALDALKGLHKVCQIALAGKDGKQYANLETRSGSFIAMVGVMQGAEKAIAAIEAAQSQPTAKQRYEALDVEKYEADPVERFRAFCSLAMNGQDWLDVEPFFDAIKLQPVAPAEPSVVMLGDEPVQEAARDQRDDRQYRNGFISGFTAGERGDYELLATVEKRAGNIDEYSSPRPAASPVELPVVAQKDVDRYQWLRAGLCTEGDTRVTEAFTASGNEDSYPTEAQFDAAIDAAIAAAKQGGAA